MLDNPMIAAEEARLERAFAHNDDPDAIGAMEEVAEILEARRLMLKRVRDALNEMAEARDWSKTRRAVQEAFEGVDGLIEDMAGYPALISDDLDRIEEDIDEIGQRAMELAGGY